ncbi:MAG: Flp pilus assembly complex ATPase component TadA [Phycisphaerales bacterium]|nr:Flp pilus assembly complex ATPase component TadA [Phycisphaerales bacterium]
MQMTSILAEAVTPTYIAWWKALLGYAPFIAWAWLISTKLDKDAKYFHLDFKKWGTLHLCAGALALVALLAIPIFWIGWPVSMMILIGPVLAYWKMRNEAVPESQRFQLGGGADAEVRREARKQAKAARDAALVFTASNNVDRPVPEKDDIAYTTHILAEDVVGPAVEGRATKLELRLTPKGCAVAQTVDGIRYKRDTIAADAGARLFAYVMDIAGMNVDDRRRRQAGKCEVAGPAGRRQLTITVNGSSSGQEMRIDIDRANQLDRPFDGLGLLPQQMERLQATQSGEDRSGVFLIGAPSGHGGTTTAYSLISRHDAYLSNIKTLEVDVMRRVEGVDHVEWDASDPNVDYATALQSILRRDPDVVLAMDVRDSETAKIIADGGLKGPLVYVPIAKGSITDSIREWARLVGDVKKATSCLRAVSNQRLLRKLCPNCRTPYSPTPEQLKALNLPAGKVQQLYAESGKVQVKNKIEGCSVCNGTGFLGQTAVFEVFEVDDEARRMLNAGDLKAALAHARRNKMIYLKDAAIAKVISGETSINELIRVIAAPPASTAPKKAPTSGAA